MWKWITTLNVQELAIELAHCGYERNMCKWLGLYRRYVENIVKCDQRQIIISKCDTPTPELVLLVWIVDHAHHLCPNTVSHCNMCGLSHMEPMVQMSNNKIWHVSIFIVSSFDEEYRFVVICNICSIMCEVWASTIFPCHDTFALQKGLIYKRN